MAGECSYHEQACPQWCGDCGGFIGWHCYICGESMPDDLISPGHCVCLGGSRHWVDGPAPRVGQLMDIGMRRAGLNPENEKVRSKFAADWVIAQLTPLPWHGEN